MLRGNDKQAIFVDDADRHELEELVEEGVSRFGHCIHAYCWMGNHIHMAIQVGEIPLSKIMHNLSFRYTSYFNWRHGRVGHVFQGRYKALLIDADSRLQELVRYIHLNPVRAGIVTDAVDFEWSGHRVYLGLAHKEWISTEAVLSLFGSDGEQARRSYAEFVATESTMHPAPDFKRGTHAGVLIGDDAFAQKTLASTRHLDKPTPPSLATICAAVGKVAGISDASFTGPNRDHATTLARGAAAYLAMQLSAGSLAELSTLVGRDPATLSREAKKIRHAGPGSPGRMLAAKAEHFLKSATMQA
jgi:REP element-mobilizing transposase RayT